MTWTDPTPDALAEAMRDHVRDLTPPPDLVAAATRRAARRPRPGRGFVLGAVATAAAAVVVIAIAVLPAARTGAPVAPTYPTYTPSPEATQVPRVRLAPRSLPRDFRSKPLVDVSEPHGYENGTYEWVEILAYGRFPHGAVNATATLRVETRSGATGRPITAEGIRDVHPTAYETVVAGRAVVHIENTLGRPDGTDYYGWTEAPGIQVAVIGTGDVTDAEVRAFIAALRRVP